MNEKNVWKARRMKSVSLMTKGLFKTAELECGLLVPIHYITKRF